MPQTPIETSEIDTVVQKDTQRDTELGKSQKTEAAVPKTADQWIEKVETRLEEVLARQKDFQAAFAAKTHQQREIDALGKDEIRALVEALDLEDVESLLRDLEYVKKSDEQGVTKEATKEIVLYEKQLEQVVAEKHASRRHAESASIPGATKGSLQEQVFENFAEFLGKENAKIQYGGTKLEVRITSDGIYHITVPEPTFENMVALAGEMNGKFSHEHGNSPQEFGQQLMDAALIMDRQAIFSSSAVEALYNAGYQLKKVFDTGLEEQHFSFEEIQQRAKDLFAVMTPAQKEALQEKINNAYLQIFLGKHDIELHSGGGALVIQKSTNVDGSEKRGSLYDALFQRWQKSKEGQEWMQAHKEELQDLENPTTKKAITDAYDAWLSDPKRQYDTIHRFRKFIEAKVTPGSGTDRRFGVLLAQWRHQLLDTHAAKQITQDIDGVMNKKSMSAEEQLSTINAFFQPDKKVPPEALRYLPADVLAIFNKPGSTPEERNAAACIIADSYVKHILQGRGFSVFTQLDGTHTQLIAIDQKTGKGFVVDPNTPKNINGVRQTGVRELSETMDGELLSQLRTIQKDGQVEIARNVVVKTKNGGIIADGSAIQISGLMANMIGEKQDSKMTNDVKFAAAERARLLFPDNPIAWLRLAQTATDGKNEEYFRHAKELDPRLPDTLAEALQKDLRIGAWGVAGSPNPNLQRVVQVADRMITATGNPAEGLNVLDGNDLTTLRDMLQQQLTSGGLNVADTDYATDRLREVFTAINNFSRVQQIRQLDEQGPAAFYLSGREKDILSEGHSADEARDLIEKEILKLADPSILNPGSYLSEPATKRIQSRLGDIGSSLDARRDNTPGSDIEDVYLYLRNITEAFTGSVNLAGLIESGNPKNIEQARDFANRMDQLGGLNVFHTLYSLHEGRVGGLVSDLRREMKRVMQKNAEKTGHYYSVQEDYQRLSETIIPQQLDLASAGVGPYAEKFGVFIDPANPQLGFTPESLQAIKDYVTMDLKFAQILFTITGEYSAIYIRGRLPEYVHDPGAMAAMNAEWQGLDRFGEITHQNKAVAKLQFENASRQHLGELLEACEKNANNGDLLASSRMAFHQKAERIKKALKQPKLFDNYVDRNAIDILAPQANMWWENRFIRTLPMIYSLNGYEESIYPGHPRSGYEHRVVRDLNNKEFDAPVGGDPEFGILLRAFLYVDGAFADTTDAVNLFQGKGTDYFPDILLEPFSYQSGTEHTENGVPSDTRFVELFGGNTAGFLDHIPLPANYVPINHAGSAQYRLAMERFDRFQHFFRPKMDAIRNKRINNTDPRVNNPNLPFGPLTLEQSKGFPVQTNFALNNGAPQSARVDIEIAFGAGASADAFQAFIGSMQAALRGTGHGEDGMAYALVTDPLFENQHYSPMSIIDVPMWMLDGNDLSGQVTTVNRQDPLRVKLGAGDRVGRFIGDVLELGPKTRAGLIQLVKANPNNAGQFFKIVEQMADGVKNTRGTESAHEIELMAVGEYMKMMLPPALADLLGLGSLHLARNTEYRKIMGSLINAYSSEEVFSMVESHIMPGLDEERRKRLRRFLKITRGKRTKRSMYQLVMMLLLSTFLQTTGSVLGVLNEGVTKG